MVAPAPVPWARPWRGAVGCKRRRRQLRSVAKLLRNRIPPQESPPQAVTQRSRCFIRPEWPCALPIVKKWSTSISTFLRASQNY